MKTASDPKSEDHLLQQGDVGVGHGFAAIGKKRVIAPHGEQFIQVVAVFDAADDQSGGDGLSGAGQQGVADLGDFGACKSTPRCPGLARHRDCRVANRCRPYRWSESIQRRGC